MSLFSAVRREPAFRLFLLPWCMSDPLSMHAESGTGYLRNSHASAAEVSLSKELTPKIL